MIELFIRFHFWLVSCTTNLLDSSILLLGSRCRNNKDCGHNMCCAKQHGESVCKQKLPLQAKCFIPPGGIEYVIDTMCPCEEGLVCSETVVMEKREWVFFYYFLFIALTRDDLWKVKFRQKQCDFFFFDKEFRVCHQTRKKDTLNLPYSMFGCCSESIDLKYAKKFSTKWNI